MAHKRQSDLFKETRAFPEDLFQAEKFDAVKYFMEQYFTFDNHIQRLKNTKEVTDELSKEIAQEILDYDSVDRLEDLEKTIQEQVDIEITHGVIRHFYIEQGNLFKQESFTYANMVSLLRNRKQKIENVDLNDMSPAFREKIETAITICKMIDEDIARILKLDLYD